MGLIHQMFFSNHEFFLLRFIVIVFIIVVILPFFPHQIIYQRIISALIYKYFKNQSFSLAILMKITITDTNNFHSFDVDPDEEIENLKALIEVQMNIPSNRQQLMFQGKVLADKDKLNAKGISENQLIYLIRAPPQQPQVPIQPMQPAQQPAQKGGMSIADMVKNFNKDQKNSSSFREKTVQQFMLQAQKIYNELKNDHYKLSEMSQNSPELVNAVMNKDIRAIAQLMKKNHNGKMKKLHEQNKKFQELSKDPMNPEYQKMLEERIQMENVEKNLQYAHEYIPQVFGHITMLYINASVNKVAIQAFVDTGAQSTIMSQSLAERCGLMRLVDKRSAGVAVGVGSCKILGKIHAAEIQIEKKFITCSFTVIENNSVQFLLGLDMLKRFSCYIDLKKNELNFQDGMIVTKFLSDGQISKNKKAPSKEEVEKKLKKLYEMGFGKEQSLHALKNCNFNQEIASNMLMQKKYGK